MSVCKSCHKHLSDDTRADALYCSSACRQRAYRRRKAAEKALAETPVMVINRHASKLISDADSAADLEHVRELLIKIARACHQQLRIADAERGRLVDQQQRLPD